MLVKIVIDTINFIHNNNKAENAAVCGTRGWKCPGDDDFSAEDQKLYSRSFRDWSCR
ncbi:MAG: hypothetical protein PHV32_06515 [Eubacteriales bacterium]|nr:hypothetical protein [Eubacteriales bacterium]